MKVEYINGGSFYFYRVQLLDNNKNFKRNVSVLMRLNRVQVQIQRKF